ncbi:gliding motility-associated protein GldE [Echinicola jeungdonensis]|uniref:Gliding motility-associated protein GldE n=1 Tax=Echinicola jeungdonensis TaxID=709343 RepID=A0ABV5J6P2_9BACT|nr:gliding motility-associated protein GldE [Echinicola jeungdonensis]MDN3669250.1 gliding motility-associated protein GldE [Echinicola jeungdonensis]
MDDPYPSIMILAEINQVSASYIIVNSLIFLALLCSSALVSGSEVAFFSLSHEDLNTLNSESDEKSELVIKLIEAPQRLLSTILILNNLINIGIVTLTTFVTWSLFGLTTTGIVVILVQTIGVTFAIVFFGEIVPKVYANNARVTFSKLMAKTLNLFSILLSPLSAFLMAISNIIERRIERKGYTLSVNELHQALEITADNTTEGEKDIFKGIVNFGTLSVKQVMRSRMDITAVDEEMDFHELMDKINKSGYSRIPVYTETIDNIKGILYIKDLLYHIEKEEDFQWQNLTRKGFFVPENKKVDSLLKDFQNKRVHMAIVVDEYGGTSGLVTLEDLIEEIIGEINDEFDEGDDQYFQQIDESTFIFEGKVSLNDFCKKLDLDPQCFDEVKGDSESLGGLLLEINAKLPKSGSKIQFERFHFTILAVDARKIKKVKVHIQSPETDDIVANED